MSVEPRIYYFLGNITSHILHALPLQKELGGTFIVLSEKAKKEVEKYNVPVIAIDNKPRRWTRFGYKIKPVFHYLKIDNDLKKTSDFLNNNADVVIFYELYDFSPSVRITTPKTVFLTHGNMLKDYMAGANRVAIFKEQYDYMTALGPHLKKEFVQKNGIDPSKLVDIGIARTDEIVKNQGKVIIPQSLIDSGDIDPKKPIVSYLPTFWGASSIYTVGKDIVRNFPDTHTLLFRPHPQTPAKLMQEYFAIIATKKPGTIVYAPEGKYKGVGLTETFDASSAIIGDISSVMLEALLVEKPLIFASHDSNMQDPREYAAISDVVAHSQTITSDNAGDIPEIVERAIANGIDKKVWKDTENNTFFHNDGTSVASIAAFIRSLVK